MVMDEEVENYLKSRVIQGEIECESKNDSFKYGKLSIIVNPKKDEIDNDKLERLLPNEIRYDALAADRPTNFKKHPYPKSTKSGKDEAQLSSNLILKRNAPVVITCNHSEAKYRDDGLNNGARGYIDSVQPNKDNPKLPEVVWVVFMDERIGNRLRQDKKYLTNHLYT